MIALQEVCSNIASRFLSPGDKVVCMEDCGGIKKGATYTVKSIVNSFGFRYLKLDEIDFGHYSNAFKKCDINHPY